MLIDESITLYLQTKGVKSHLSKSLSYDMKLFTTFINNDVNDTNDFNITHLTDFLDDQKIRGLRALTVLRRLSTIKGYFEWLNANQLAHIDLEELKNYKVKAPNQNAVNVLLPEQVNEFLHVAKLNVTLEIRNMLALRIIYATGMAPNEVINIKLNDIKYTKNYIRVSDVNNKERLAIIDDETLSMIKGYCNRYRKRLLNREINNRYLFNNKRDGHIDEKMLRDATKKFAIRANLPDTISPMTFRHSFAAALASKGASQEDIAMLLGLKAVKNASKYMEDIEKMTWWTKSYKAMSLFD